MQLGRELGINRINTITRKVNTFPYLSDGMKERHVRNFQRTWLFIWIMDKSFNITTGRMPSVPWTEVTPSIADWWKHSSATPLDRVTCGIVEMRVILVSKPFDNRFQRS